MKVLLLRFSSIGDIVLTTPVARCLHNQLGVEVHYLTKQAFAPILTANPHVARVFSFQKEVTEVLPALQKEQYDWVIDLHHNLRSLRVRWALGRPTRAFNKLNFEKWLLVNLKIDRLPEVHVVQRYLATVQHLGVAYDGQGLDFFIPVTEEIPVGSLSPLLTEGHFTAFVVGAAHATKQLPLAKAVEICRDLAQPVALLGGPTDRVLGQAIAEGAGKHVVNLCGQLRLHQSASVLRQSARVLSPDTGLMHIAAALRKPIVVVWGSTTPRFGMYPFYPTGWNLHTSMEVADLPCRPCSKIGYAACPRGHFRCMQAQSAEQIRRALHVPNDRDLPNSGF